jgi:hypothetical protein
MYNFTLTFTNCLSLQIVKDFLNKTVWIHIKEHFKRLELKLFYLKKMAFPGVEDL